LSLAKIVTHNILKENMTVDLLATLAKMYEQPSFANKVHHMKKLFNLKMAEECSFTLHLSEFNMIINQLTSVGIMFDDKVQVLLILYQLPERWQGSVIAVSNFAGKKKLKLSEVVSLILTEEVRRKLIDSEGSFSSGSAPYVKQRGRSQKKFIRTRTETNLRKKIDQSLQYDLLKVMLEL